MNKTINRAVLAAMVGISVCLFWGTVAAMAHAYAPPICSDTDTDQTNDCGPGDSTDAGTRNEDDRGSGR